MKKNGSHHRVTAKTTTGSLTRFLERFELVRSELLVHDGAQLSAGREFPREQSRHHFASRGWFENNWKNKISFYRRANSQEFERRQRCIIIKWKINRPDYENRDHLFRCFIVLKVNDKKSLLQPQNRLNATTPSSLSASPFDCFPTAFRIFDFVFLFFPSS